MPDHRQNYLETLENLPYKATPKKRTFRVSIKAWKLLKREAKRLSLTLSETFRIVDRSAYYMGHKDSNEPMRASLTVYLSYGAREALRYCAKGNKQSMSRVINNIILGALTK